MSDNPRTLAYWKDKAKKEIYRWLTEDGYADKIMAETYKSESLGPFTKFLYCFAIDCEGAGWGVMIDFDERKQRTFLVDKYYKWMHQLRDEMQADLDKINA